MINNYNNNNTDKGINNNENDRNNITCAILVNKVFLHHTWKFWN